MKQKFFSRSNLHVIAAGLRTCKDILTNPLFGKFKINNSSADLCYEIKDHSKQCFIGYYDINPYNTDCSLLLYHRISSGGDLCSPAEICIYDVNNLKTQVITNTYAWCYQQGARLRWIDNENIIFNNVCDGHYVAQIWNISSLKCIKQFNAPIYDIAHNKSFGIGLDFVHLQEKRKGYGYRRLTDEKQELDDYIYKVHFETGEISKLISVNELCEKAGIKNAENVYLNHISIAPSDRKFLVLLIEAMDDGTWKTYSYIINIIDKSVLLLDSKCVISHYAWKDENDLLVTRYDGEHKFNYALYNLNNKKVTIYDNKKLNSDGHPTYFSDKSHIISDTYPNNQYVQNLFIYDLENDVKQNVMEVYHSRFPVGERRCDLHPRLVNNSNVLVDCSYSGKRSIIALKLKKANIW